MWWKKCLDLLAVVWYGAAAAVRRATRLAELLQELLRVVTRKALWTAPRKRPRVTRSWVGRVRLDFSYSRRHGYQLLSWAALVDGPFGRQAGPERGFDVPRKPDGSQSGSQALGPAAAAGRRLAKTPVLASFLVDQQYEDNGGPRVPSYLIVRPGAGQWHCTLKDPTEARQLRVSITDLDTMEAALEALLTSQTCPWERDQFAEDRRPKKKK